ncbi:MAG TPA: single-stranded-DNA-specific exonuclease RecJ [Treponemataceae bacterium]|nr:single-stranded-DNA-specific exonuclease RecJ [Treponemataceae bacterium]
MIWNKKDINRTLVKDMVRRFECDALTASILARRNIIDGPDILYFLEDDLRYLHNPFLFKDMEDAVDRVLQAREEGEKVLIFGDRDVDGITSTSLLHRALTDIGIDTDWRVPSGNDPYGLTIAAVETHAENSGTLIITVDNGISCRDAVARANELGIDVVVLDHHNPPDVLPDAVAIINPKMEDSGYPFRDLAGCAVVWKFITALRFARTELYKQQICLLNVRPANESYLIEAIKVVNMTEQTRISETVVPGMVSISQTRLVPFLQDQQIFVWDAPLQQKQLATIFGKGVEFNFHDLAPEISRSIPAIRNMSLLRLKDFSRIGRYRDKPISELDGFFNIFVTFIQRRNELFGDREKQELQLVALGTLADLMPLENENRILVRQGLAAINESPLPGLAELMARQNLSGKKIGTGDIAWLISPAINATGRMGSPEVAVSLLLSENQGERNKLSEEVIRLNNDRKQLGTDAWGIAEPLARESLEKHHGNLVIAADPRIHRGITGIMANRLTNCFQVPAVVLSFMEDETLVGSMRSARGYNLQNLLEPCADLFIDHGGHTFAAGFSIHKKNLDELYDRFLRLSADIQFPDSENGGEVMIDAELPHEYLTPSILDLTDRFEPYGEGNDPLTFLARNMKILAADIMGKTEKLHLKLTFACGTYKWPAVYWKAAERLNRDFAVGDAVDTVFTVGRNSFNGSDIPQLILQDVQKPAGA